MNDTLRIRNWDKWQSYRGDRNQPPWIKLHRCLAKNVEWAMLTDAQRGQLVCIWILAADSNGQVPASPGAIKKLAGLESEPDIELLQRLGFIEADAKVTPKLRQRAAGSGCQPDAKATLVPMVLLDSSSSKKKDKSVVASDARRLASLLADLMRRNNPKAKIPEDPRGWFKAIDLIHSKDGYEWSEIEAVLRWSQDSDFWRSNILSGDALRRQMGTLVLQKSRAAPTAPKEPPTIMYDDWKAAEDAEFARKMEVENAR